MIKHSPSKMGAREPALSRSSHRACSLMAPCVLLELLHTDLLKEGCKKRFLWHFHQTVVARRPRISFLFFFFSPWEHLMRAQILRPRRSHASCSTFACHPPLLFFSLFIWLPHSCLCLVVAQQKAETTSRYSKVTVKGQTQARDTMRRR